MSREEAIKVLNDYDINFEGHTPEEVAEAHEMAIKAIFRTILNENEQIIRISKGTLKARTGRYVVYDVEWLKEHFNTTEAKIYGQPSEDCISREAVLDSLRSWFAEGFDSDKWWNSTHVLDAINKAPSATPQPKEEPQQKTGHWIMRKRDGSGWKDTTVYVNSEGTITESRDEGAYCKCSECGEWLVGSDEYVCGARYCPSCGTKMEEKK